MNTRFSRGVGLVGVSMIGLVMCLGLPAMAADDASPVSTGGTNRFIANATTTANLGSAVKIDQQHQVGLWVRFQGDAAGTDDIVVKLARSANGTTFETTPPDTLLFTNALAGTTAVVGYHQLPESLVGSVNSLKVVSVQNYSATVNATNCSIWIVKKKER